MNITPADLDLPAKFERFQHTQLEAIEYALDSQKRFVGMNLQTGSGKTLIAAALIAAVAERGVVLTATKALQEQYEHDFSGIGLVDMRGKTNYRCTGTGANVSCRFGELEGCKRKRNCTYVEARREFCSSDFGITNYAYWIRSNKRAPLNLTAAEGGPNPPAILILDEGHDAYAQLANALQKVIREQTFRDCGIRTFPKTEEMQEWISWAGEMRLKIVEDLDAVKLELAAPTDRQRIPRLRERLIRLESCEEVCESLIACEPSEWLCEKFENNSGRFYHVDCIWPGAYAERYLFAGIPKVVILSATLRPLSLKLLGLGNDVFDFREWPRIFPAKNSPRYHFRTARINRKTEQDESIMKLWVERIDSIIASRKDRKGIIHTVSFKRQQYLIQHSRFSEHFWCNSNEPNSDTAIDICKRFKEASAPAILVSPSFSTGWDFPGRECEWQIISKVPFPGKSKIHEARCAKIPNYVNYLVMQELIQACGRGTRFYDDRCEVFCLDDNISWFMQMSKSLAPGWFSFTTINTLPKPIERAPERIENNL